MLDSNTCAMLKYEKIFKSYDEDGLKFAFSEDCRLVQDSNKNFKMPITSELKARTDNS